MPLRVSYKIFSKITFVDIIYVMMFGVLYQGREGGPQNFFKNRFFRVGIGIGTRYATAGPYILWHIYTGVMVDSVVFPAGSAYRCTMTGEGSEIFSKIGFPGMI